MIVALWKPVGLSAVPKRYQASDMGIIRTLPHESMSSKNGGDPFVRHMPGRYLKERINKHTPSLGVHPVVGIYLGHGRGNTQNREYRVARLVCAAFHGVPFDSTDQRQVQRWRIRHLDGDVLNNCASNLQWVYSAGENGSEGKNQSVYEKNLDGWRASSATESASARLSRLFGEVYGDELEECVA